MPVVRHRTDFRATHGAHRRRSAWRGIVTYPFLAGILARISIERRRDLCAGCMGCGDPSNFSHFRKEISEEKDLRSDGNSRQHRDDPLNGNQIPLILPALCWSRYRSDFYAVTTHLSVAGLRFRSALVPGLGETLTCSVRHAGTLEVLVVHRNDTAFVTRVTRADVAIPVIVRRLLDLAEDQGCDLAPRRVHQRFVPDRPDIFVTTASGVQVPGRLINVSASGAALQVDIHLEPGMRITLGRTPATVARRFEDGIGAAFLEPLARDNVGPHVNL